MEKFEVVQSICANGSRIAIGAYANDGNGLTSGHVRIFEYSGGAWVQVGADIDGDAAGDRSGFSVSLNSDGTAVAVGAPYRCPECKSTNLEEGEEPPIMYD